MYMYKSTTIRAYATCMYYSEFAQKVSSFITVLHVVRLPPDNGTRERECGTYQLRLPHFLHSNWPVETKPIGKLSERCQKVVTN